jgi:hypothetical protein
MVRKMVRLSTTIISPPARHGLAFDMRSVMA